MTAEDEWRAGVRRGVPSRSPRYAGTRSTSIIGWVRSMMAGVRTPLGIYRRSSLSFFSL